MCYVEGMKYNLFFTLDWLAWCFLFLFVGGDGDDKDKLGNVVMVY